MTSSSAAVGEGQDHGGVRLAGAVARLWRSLRERHPELPETPAQPGQRYPKEPPPRTGRELLVSVLREAVHELAAAHGVKVTSNRGYYHNKRFRELAHEFGLEAEEAGARGWAALTVAPDAVEERYAAQLAELETALALTPPPAPRPPKQGGGRYVPAVCACTPPHRIRVSRTTLALAVISCEDCRLAGRPHLFVEDRTASPRKGV
ncbi:hypothetical protein [Amycolatopsis sacchari]|uniref:hypothetical protein n=1 Tax=Amycolatopsis sacchari TaxID=115433 RepID=UPI003D721ECD